MKNREYILNTDVITNERVLKNHAIVIEDDRIKRVLPMAELEDAYSDYRGCKCHDGANTYSAPGFIDIHSDNIEMIIQPRPTSVMDYDMAIMEQEKQLVNQGITMMYHSLSFAGQGGGIRSRDARKSDKMRALANLIKSVHEGYHLIHHRFHCRYDIRNIDGYKELLGYIDRGDINLLSFNDHTPGQGQFRDIDKYKERMKKYSPELSNTEIDRIVEERLAVEKISTEQLVTISELAHNNNIPIASHDDDTEEKIEFVSGELKVNISEFPIEINVARKAKKNGMLTVAGAPNILLGGSHSGNMSAAEAIVDGCIDIICSDYYPQGMLHAVFKLNTDYQIPLWEAFRLTTYNPARALNIDDDYGLIAPEKKADILMIKMINNKPAIKKVLIDGVVVSELNYRNRL